MRIAREAACLNQTDLGERIGRTQAQVSRFEDGTRTPPPEVAQLIGEALGVDGERLFSVLEPAPAEVIRQHLAPPTPEPQSADDELDGPDLRGLGIVNAVIHMSGPREGTVEHVNAAGRVVAYETADRVVIVGGRGLHRPAPQATAPQARPRERRDGRRVATAASSGGDDPPGKRRPASGRPTRQHGARQ
jgi:transcriptional regulator with XRE-family HTH domain